nr:MAG TPA_asm: hypothetical protein [Caudoviricetes sp.]
MKKSSRKNFFVGSLFLFLFFLSFFSLLLSFLSVFFLFSFSNFLSKKSFE